MSNLLDANCFMEAKDRYYRFTICPGYWDWLAFANGSGRVFSVEAVQRELINGGGELASRAKSSLAPLFLPPDSSVVAEYANVAAWVQSHPQYRASAKARFLAGADPWLIAHAKASGYSVITLEVPAPSSLKDIKIPDVCTAFSVKYLNPFDLLENEAAVFRR